MGTKVATGTGFVSYLTRAEVKNQVMQIVGEKSIDRFVVSIASAVQANPALAECTNKSILSAALLGCALNLVPSPQLGQFYLVPYKKTEYAINPNTGKKEKVEIKEAQFQLGAKGYKQLAMRSGQYKDIDVIAIKQGEYLGRDKLTGKYRFNFIEDEDIRDELPVIGYMAYFELLNGFFKQIYWTKSKMEKHADTYSKAFSLIKYKELLEGKIPENELWKYSSFWYKDFDAMAEKTMIKQLISKWGIMSIEMERAINSDDAIIDDDGNPIYVEDTTIHSVEKEVANNNMVTDAPVNPDIIDIAEEDIEEEIPEFAK